MLKFSRNNALAPKSKNKMAFSVFGLSAGNAAEATDDYELLDINEMITGGKEGFSAYRVDGDSMVEDIHPGDIVFVDTFTVPEHGDIIASLVNGRLNVKFLEKKKNGLFLVSANKKYKPCEVKESDNFQIIGVVTRSLKAHKRGKA